jgi:hypothetical protein
MKTALSALLGEMFGAEKLIYGDCERWQMQCPACHEAVFKVEREHNCAKLHYFSHHRKDQLLAEECELRVGALSKEEVARHNAIARGQTLAFYLSVLSREIEASFEADVHRRRRMIKRNSALHPFSEWLRGAALILHKHDGDHWLLQVGEVVRQIAKSTFEAEKQNQISLLVWEHLLSPTGKRNLNLLFECVAVSWWLHLDDDITHSALDKLLWHGKRAGLSAVDSLANTARGDGSAKEEFVDIFLHLAASVIVGIDYLKLLREFRDRPNRGASTPARKESAPRGASANPYAWLGETPRMREWIGPKNVADLENNSFFVRKSGGVDG